MVLTISIISAVFSALVLAYAVHLSVVYHRFNEGIKSWAETLDDSTRDAINRAARDILRQLDEQISAQSEEQNKESNEEEKND
jgi:hypothetical protein